MKEKKVSKPSSFFFMSRTWKKEGFAGGGAGRSRFRNLLFPCPTPWSRAGFETFFFHALLHGVGHALLQVSKPSFSMPSQTFFFHALLHGVGHAME